jgi:serine/threonine protein kinase/WD40 repeat protein
LPVPRFVARIGDYGIEDELGRGAFGAVYRARNSRTGEVVALKLFSRADGSVAALERFRQEPRALMRAGAHPNLLRVRTAGEHAGLPYFVMDYVEGRSLDDEIAELGRLSWRRACSIARKVSLALEHLHQAGFIHRDVKPANILLDASGEPRLVDLSLALDTLRESRLTAAGQAVGTPFYMAPEQLRAGDEHATPASDVFALGVVLYELLTGAPPFWGESAAELVAAIEAGAVSPSQRRPDVPEAVSRIVLHALEASVERRIPTAAAFTAELEKVATGSTADARAPADARTGPASFPGYRILEVCGRGGSGVVLKARDERGNLVAIKVLARVHEAALARFQREQRLVELLGETEGFVPFMGSGVAPGGPYVVMRFCEGGSLRDRLRKGPLSLEEGIALARRLGQAVGRAHEKGIVHRDLKPENVLFAGEGVPLVADLGLAKHFAQAPGSSQSIRLSETGALRGTAGYMPPEQARDALRVTPAADVFSLGAIVYECLAGQAPFNGTTFLEIVDRTENAQYEPLTRVRPEVPAWLSRVIDRALSPDPGDRFPDARAFVAALVEPPAPSRSPLLVPGVLALAALAVVLALAIGARLAQLFQGGRAPPPPPVVHEPEKTLGPSPGTAPIPALCGGIRRTKVMDLAAVWGSYAWTHDAGQTGIAFIRADGSRAVSGCGDGRLIVWDVATGEEVRVLTAPAKGGIASIAAVGISDQVVSASEDGTVVLWDTEGAAPSVVLGQQEGARKIHPVAVSPDARFAATGGAGGTVRLWDLVARSLVREIRLGADVQSLAFSSDGTFVAAGGADGKVRVSPLATPGEVRAIDAMQGRVFALAALKGHRLLAGGEAGSLVPIDVDSGTALEPLEGHKQQVHAIAVSPDGNMVLSGGHDGVCLWNLAKGERRGPWAWGWVSGTAFSPDGRVGLVARHEAPSVLVDAASGRETRHFDGPDGMVLALAPSLEGTELATGGLDTALHVWDVASGKASPKRKSHAGRIVGIGALPGGRFVSTAWDKTVRIWEGGSAPSSVLETEGRPSALGLSPDRRLAAIGTEDGNVEIFDLDAWRKVLGAPTAQDRVASIAFVGSARIVTGASDGSLKLWELQPSGPDGLSVVSGPPLPAHPSPVVVAASPDGRFVVSLSRESLALADLVLATSWVRDLEHPKQGRANSLALSPDGKIVAGSFGDRTVRLFDLEKRGEEIDRVDLQATNDEPFKLMFSRDGRYVVVGTKRGVILWFALARLR